MTPELTTTFRRWRRRLGFLGPDELAARPVAVAYWVRRGWWLMALLLAVGMVVALNREVTQGVSDFRGFYQASQNLFEHGRRLDDTTFAYYLPSLEVVFIPLAWLPMPLAGAVWYLLGCLSWIGLLLSVDRYLLSDCEPSLRRVVLLLVAFLMTPLVLDGLCLGSFQTFMVWWLIAGLGRISRGRSASGSLLLGLAIWIKLLPVVGVGYLLLKRRWKPALAAVLCAVALDASFSIVGFGPRQAWVEHQVWWQGQGEGAAYRQLAHPEPISEDRLSNQSLIVILRRTLTVMGVDQGGARSQTTLLHLSSQQLTLIYWAALGALGLLVLFFLRRPGWQLSPPQWKGEIALVTLSTLWVSPVLWSYHPTAATGALAVVLAQTARRPQLGWAVLLGWIAALAMLGWPLACALGEMFWTTILLGGLLVWSAQLGIDKTSKISETVPFRQQTAGSG